ncbi:hypothetical protein [Macrococcus armenti]|uniref:hypothetical protein n=1 Tax=Macrococcus armenti TaxID=2875764 RepID=UPI001CD20838|nr:hypothetical protein [Macrococcus armenti]UBH10098.1 hypothetical protein LAU38_07370 [Macrococcus armenti]
MFNGSETSGSKLTCPYCKYEDEDCWELPLNDDGDECTTECPSCEKEIKVTLGLSPIYYANKIIYEQTNKYWWQEYKYFRFEDENRIDILRITGYEQGVNITWFTLESLIDKRVHRISDEELSACFDGINELKEI